MWRDDDPLILLVSPCHIPVRQCASAGIECVVFSLAEGLKELGVRTAVVCTKGSEVGTRSILAEREAVREVVEGVIRSDPRVVVVDHSEGAVGDLDGKCHSVMVHHIAPLYVPEARAGTRTGFVSSYLRSEYARAYGQEFRACPVLKNGISGLTASGSFQAGRYALYMGRLNRLKGIHIAAAACARENLPLEVWGGLGEEASEDVVYNDLSYLREVEELYPGTLAYRGPAATMKDKNSAFRGAFVAVVPSLEPESCSLFAVEAASLRLPVVALSGGGIGEYVSDGLYNVARGVPEEDVVSRFAEAMVHARQWVPGAGGLDGELSSVAMARRYVGWLGVC